jgi:hypothetical protein
LLGGLLLADYMLFENKYAHSLLHSSASYALCTLHTILTTKYYLNPPSASLDSIPIIKHPNPTITVYSQETGVQSGEVMDML